MKLYHLHMVLQDISANGSASGKAYGISCEPMLSIDQALTTIKMHLNSDDHVCCSAYITEQEEKNSTIVYAKNYVSILGSYYPDVKYGI